MTAEEAEALATKASPVGTPPAAKAKTTNKDGFVKGQEVSEKDYFTFLAKQRLARNNKEI